MIQIRNEAPADIGAVRDLNQRAFDQPQEAAIVDSLRTACAGLLSLVAVDGEEVVGHILFSPVTVDGPRGEVVGMGLAPMAVVPGRQRSGIGSALVERGLRTLRDSGCPFVVVLGHPGYYPRFGFVPASTRGLRSQWEGVPDEVFLVEVFDEDAMRDVAGVTRYRGEFDDAL